MNGASSVNPSATTEPAIGGLTPFSSVDWPGQLAAVVFIAGCPWRCGYCHNPQLQPRQRTLDWPAILHWLDSRRGLLDGVVFSGGEPLSEPALADMARAVQARGFAVGLHSAGIYPQRLAQLLPWLDWLALDIKTDQAGYDALTGRARSAWPVQVCLEMALEAGCALECRTTWSPQRLSEARLLALAQRWRRAACATTPCRTSGQRRASRRKARSARRRRRNWPVALPVSVTGAAERGEHKPAVPVPHYPH